MSHCFIIKINFKKEAAYEKCGLGMNAWWIQDGKARTVNQLCFLHNWRCKRCIFLASKGIVRNTNYRDLKEWDL